MNDTIVMALKLALASVLGGIVGYERERREHPAGLRTHILVCLGATLITLISMSFDPAYSDPARIAAQIVSGIGFLGAGTILRQGNIVRGLTTAASLWTVAGIGMAVARGGPYYILAVVATGIVFLTLSTIRAIEPALGKQTGNTLYFEIPAEELTGLGELFEKLTNAGLVIQAVKGAAAADPGKRAFTVRVALTHGISPEGITQMLAEHAGLDRFEWK